MPSSSPLPPSGRDHDDSQGRFGGRLDSRLTQGVHRFSSSLSFFNPIRWINSIVKTIHRLVNSADTHRSILGSVIILLVFVLSLLVSVIGYFAFYWRYVPQIGLSLPVWLQYGEGRVPYDFLDLTHIKPEIASDQTYDVSLHFTVPTNDRNMDLGNFMVRLTLVSTSPHNATLHQSSRPASVTYEPQLARNLNSFKHLRTLFLMSPPPSIQKIKLPLIERRVLQSTSNGKRGKLGYAKVEVGRQDAYDESKNDRTAELQVYQATLVLDAHLEGVRWVLYYHPYLSFGVFSTAFLLAELIAVVSTWAIVLYRTPNQSSPRKPNIKIEDDRGGDPGLRKKRRFVKTSEGDESTGGQSSVSLSSAEEEEDYRTDGRIDDSRQGAGTGGRWVIKTEKDEDEGILLENSDLLSGNSRSTATRSGSRAGSSSNSVGRRSVAY